MTHFRTLSTLAIAALAVGDLANSASANVSGFNSGTGYTANVVDGNTPAFTANGVTLTTSGVQYTAASVFYNTPQSINSGGFIATFTYRQTATVNTSGTPGDGVTFAIQNNAPTALGDNGSGLGYDGISNGFAVALDLNQGFPRREVTGLITSRFYNDNAATPITGVSLENGNPVDVSLAYTASARTLVESLRDTVTNATFTTTFTNVDVPGTVGSPTAYVGFTGGTGGASNTQVISNFTFTSTVPEPTVAAALLLPALVLRRRR